MRIKHPQPSVIGYTSNMALRSFKCCHQGNKHALSGRHTHTHFSLWSFLTQMARCDNSIKQNQKKRKSHLTVSDFQSPACVSWNLLLTTYSPRQSSARAHTSNSHSSPLSGVSFTSPRSAREKRWESGITMAAGVGPGQQWLTAGFRPCDEVRPLCLTPLPPALPSLLPSQQCAPWSPLPKLMDNGVGIEGGSIDICCFDTDPCWPSLSRATPIISFSPDSCWPLNLLLSYSRHPPKSIVLLPLPLWSCMHLVDLHSYPPTAEIPGKPESLNLSPPFPLLRWANKQKKQRGQSSSNIFLAMGNFLYLKRWNWTLRGRVPDHWRALKRGRI